MKAAQLKRFADKAETNSRLPPKKTGALAPVKHNKHSATLKAVRAAGHEVDEVLEDCCPDLSASDSPDKALLAKLRKSVAQLGDFGVKIKKAAQELDAEAAQRVSDAAVEDGLTTKGKRLTVWLLYLSHLGRAEGDSEE